MKAKRISPSLIPAEVVVPVEKLGLYCRTSPNGSNYRLLVRGFGIKDGEMVFLGLSRMTNVNLVLT